MDTEGNDPIDATRALPEEDPATEGVNELTLPPAEQAEEDAIDNSSKFVVDDGDIDGHIDETSAPAGDSEGAEEDATSTDRESNSPDELECVIDPFPELSNEELETLLRKRKMANERLDRENYVLQRYWHRLASELSEQPAPPSARTRVPKAQQAQPRQQRRRSRMPARRVSPSNTEEDKVEVVASLSDFQKAEIARREVEQFGIGSKPAPINSSLSCKQLCMIVKSD
eukprot:m.171863 g.171863  ORF g.171863 m.171863 type:complete len:228 (+) comp16712_c0_seq8:2-685(+)